MPRVSHFEISADDPERATKFYALTFGWKIKRSVGRTDCWLVITGDAAEPGIEGVLAKRERHSNTITNTIEVPSVYDFAHRVQANGGKVLRHEMAIPGVGCFILCQDTEGNTFGMMEASESAK